MRASRAFSLLELSVVLVILSLLVGFGVNIGQDAVKGSTRLAMQTKMATIKQSLDAYAERNGYLPCPADPAMLPNNAAYGAENRNGTLGCATSGAVYNNSSVWFGTVPVRALGLNESYLSDEWGNKLTYGVSAAHVNSFMAYGDNVGSIIINSNTLAAPITLSQNAGTPGNGATYVVISHGKNGRGAFPVNSNAALACTGGTIDVQNCDRNNAVFYDSEFNEGAQAATQFDDYVVWGTNITYRTPLGVMPNVCPAGVCEAWCAPCEQPPSTPQSNQSQAPNAPTRLCAKFITRNVPYCEAHFIWAADSTRPVPTGEVPCP